MLSTAWPQPGTIALWYARVPTSRLAQPTATFEHYLQCFTEGESQRAKRYLFAEPRNRYIVARWMLRQLLGRYCDQPPETLEILTTPNEKPYLATNPQLQFNVSHSGELVVIGIATHLPLGVDTEQINAARQWQTIARHQFHPAEQQWLLSQPAERQLADFYTIWTSKEAYLKGLGVGLGHPLTGFAIVPDEPTRRPAPELDSVHQWQVQSIELFDDYAIAVASPAGMQLECLKFEI